MSTNKPKPTYTEGLPFTLDNAEMLKKTIKNRFHNKNEYLSQLARLGIINGKTGVDIKNTNKNIAVTFDSDAKLTREELENLIYDIYDGNPNSIENPNNPKLQNFGLSIAAALASEPKEIVIEVNGTNNNAFRMTIDKNFLLKPKITDLKSPIKTTKITVIKDPKSKSKPVEFKGILDYLTKDKSEIIGDLIDSIHDSYHQLRYGMDDTSKLQIEIASRFSQIDVKLNNKKINQGLHLEDRLFEKSYTLKDGSTAVLSYPKNHFSKRKFYDQINRFSQIYFIKDNIFLSEFGLANYMPNIDYGINTPDIVLQSSKLIPSMSRDGINIDSIQEYKEELEVLIEKFGNDAFLNMEFPKNTSWTKKSQFISERLIKNGLIKKTNKGKHFKWGGLNHYNSGNWGNTKTSKQHKKKPRIPKKIAKQLLQTNIIKDSTGKEYTIKEFETILSTLSTFTYSRTLKEANSKKSQDLNITDPIFIVPKNRNLSDRNSIISTLLDNRYAADGFFKSSNLKNLIQEKDNEEEEIAEKNLDKLIKTTKKRAKWTILPTASGVLSYEATPYVIDAAQFIGNYIFIENPIETALITGLATSTAMGFKKRHTIINQTKKLLSPILPKPKAPKLLTKKEEKTKFFKTSKYNLNYGEIFSNLSQNEQKYIKKLFSMLQDFNITDFSLCESLNTRLQLQYKKGKDKGFKNRNTFTIDCHSETFEKKVKEYSEGNFEIITNEIRRYAKLAQTNLIKQNMSFSFATQQSSLDKYLATEMLHYNQNNLLNQYFKENSQFQSIFQNITQSERQNLIKLMINDTREIDSPYEDWLFQNYEQEIETVTNKLITKEDYTRIINLYNNPQISIYKLIPELEYKFSNMTTQEKLEVLNYFEEYEEYEKSKSRYQSKFEHILFHIAPEFNLTFLENINHSCSSRQILETIIDNKIELLTNEDITSHIENQYRDTLYRRSLKIIGDLIPKRQLEINQILY